jgi:hypothetical protein
MIVFAFLLLWETGKKTFIRVSKALVGVLIASNVVDGR